MKTSRYALILVATVVLAGCFSSDDHVEEAPPAPPPVTPVPPVPPTGAVPPGATASIEAFVAFLVGLMRSETAAPLTVDGVVPPTSETAAPVPVN
jgi:hypothetical protein